MQFNVFCSCWKPIFSNLSPERVALFIVFWIVLVALLDAVHCGCHCLMVALLEVIMLICVFIFEMEGLDEGSWIKVLNLTPGAGRGWRGLPSILR